MTTEHTISIPGILPSLLEEVKKMRDRQAEESDRQSRGKEALESKRMAESQQAFLDYLNKYAGTILGQLDTSISAPIIEGSTSNWSYGFRVAHTVITLKTPESLHGGNCTVGVSIKGGYFGDSEIEWINKEYLSDYLLSLVGMIIEQYQQYRFLAAELEIYNNCLRNAAQKTENDIASDKHSLWTWPDRTTLNLYKITWTKGGYYDPDTREAYLQYESGWSLSDNPYENGYFQLLTATNEMSTRNLNVAPNTIELFSITQVESVPVELMREVCKSYDVVIVPNISMCRMEWTEEQILAHKRTLERCELDEMPDSVHILFPEYLPKIGSGEIPDLAVFGAKFVELGRVPCLGIRLAVEAIASGTVLPKYDDHSPW